MAHTKPLERGANDYAILETPTATRKTNANDSNDADANKPNGNDSSGQLVPLSQLFVFADKRDVLLMAVGTLSAVGSGIAQPLQVVLFGDITNSLNANASSPADFRAGVATVARHFALVSTAVIVCCFLQAACWAVTGSRQAKRIRGAYVGAILTNEMSWFDLNNPMELSTRVVDSAVTIQEGMGRKIGDAVQFATTAVASIVIGFVKGWELALLLMAAVPLIAFSAFLSIRVLATTTQASTDAYGKAGAIAQEALTMSARSTCLMPSNTL
jgi:ATP-binding cassette, subfamily B (MDR/TAP), member 1